MTKDRRFSARKSMLRFLHDRRGATAALFAVLMTTLLGVAGLGVDVGIWYTLRRQYQSAADVAAISGAMEAYYFYGTSDIDTQAQYAARLNLHGGSATNPTVKTQCTNPSAGQMCVNNPPLMGNYTSSANIEYVETILAEPGLSIFPGLVGYKSAIVIRTRAVAGLQSTSVPVCMLALGTSGEDLHVNGNVGISLQGCAFFSDSTSSDSILVDGAAGVIHTAGTDTVGGATLHGATSPSANISPAIATNVSPAVADPYGSVTITPPSTCINQPAGSTFTLVPGSDYCSLTISSGDTVTIPTGVYYLVAGVSVSGSTSTGNLNISGGTINGASAGVTFVLTATGTNNAGTVSITGGTGSLTAPLAANSGVLPGQAAASTGLLIFQDPNKSANSGGNTITPGCGSGALTLTGAIVTPNTQDTMQGNPTSCSACLELIANSFHLGGTPLLNINCSGSSGIQTASVPGYVVRLAE